MEPLTIDILLRKIGNGGEATTEEIKRLTVEVEKGGQAAIAAGDALDKLLARRGGNTGAGLATAPGDLGAAEKGVQLGREQIAVALELESALGKTIVKKQLLGVEYAREAAALAKIKSALDPVRAAHQSQATVLDELKKAQGGETAEAEKATAGKKSMLEGLKGLSTEFPHVAQLIRATTSVWGALAVGLTAAIAATRENLADIDKIEDSARAFDTVGSSVATLAERQRELAVHNKTFEGDYARIATNINSAASGLARMNENLAEQHRLQLGLVDAQYKLDMARIKASGVSGPRKEMEEAAAELRFTARKKEIDAAAEVVKQKNLEAAARAAAAVEGTATAQKTADTDAGRATAVATRAAAAAKILEEQRKFAQRIAEGKDGPGDRWNYDGTVADLKKEGIDTPKMAGTTAA